MSEFDERDAQIAKAIRREIDKLKATRDRCNYPPDSQNAAHLAGQEIGLRQALAFVDPAPHS